LPLFHFAAPKIWQDYWISMGMKNIFLKLTVLFLVFTGAVNAQDYVKVDATVQAYPKSYSDIDKLAGQITADFKRDDEKARAIFTWIALNIKYDVAAYGVNERPVAYSYRTEEEKQALKKKFDTELAIKTLKSRKGVCQGYSVLYEQVAEKCGLEAVFIPGTSKSHPMHIGKGPGAKDHAWNAVKIDGQWKLLDVTWAAGVVTGQKLTFNFKFNDGYFFTEPDLFFLNHFPDDPKWLLTNKTEKDFADLPLYYGNYLIDDYRFITPVTGTISRANILAFKIKGLKPEDKVHYAFSQDKVYKEANVKQNGAMTEFEVPLDAKSAGTLTVYINQKSAVAYRINKA
jgi:transglutaminase-like putative cysteine protease